MAKQAKRPRRQQFNIVTDSDTVRRLAELLPIVSRALNVTASKADLFRLGLIELERRYLGEASK